MKDGVHNTLLCFRQLEINILPVTNYTDDALTHQIASQLMQSANASFLWTLLCFADETYFDNKVFACGISVSWHDDFLYVADVVCCDKDGNLLASKTIDKSQQIFIIRNNFPYLVNPYVNPDEKDLADAQAFFLTLLIAHSNIKHEIYFDNRGKHIIYVNETLDSLAAVDALDFYQNELKANAPSPAHDSEEITARLKVAPIILRNIGGKHHDDFIKDVVVVHMEELAKRREQDED